MSESESDPRIWKALSWVAVAILLAVGSWWLLCLPTVGKGGLFLAAGAVLMPLFWEKIGIAGKMSWIAMLFVLLAVEDLAIDKEHRENAEAQQKALKTIGDGFTKVLTDQKDSFSSLITKSDRAFKETTEQASAQFSATMAKAQQNLNNMTGGSTYPLVVPNFLQPSNVQNTFGLMLSAQGKNPLFDVAMYPIRQLPLPKVDSAAELLAHSTMLFGAASLSSNRAIMLPTTIAPSVDSESNYQIASVARNGMFFEILHVRKNGEWVKQGNGLVGPWEYSYEITRNGKKFKSKPWAKTFFSRAHVITQP
jgi:hypothetical protein